MFIGLECDFASGVSMVMLEASLAADRLETRVVYESIYPLENGIRERIGRARRGEFDEDEWSKLDRDVTELLSGNLFDLISNCGRKVEQIRGIGISGFVILCHPPSRQRLARVLTLGDPQQLASRLGRPVVGRFAESDIAAGGVGGPVQAWFDWRLFVHPRLSRVVVRLADAAGITFVPAASQPCDVVSYDVGPAGMLVDMANRPKSFSSGRINAMLLQEILNTEFYTRRPPKLCSPRDWLGVFAPRLTLLANKHGCTSPENLSATLVEVVAQSVIRAIGQLTERPHEVILTGPLAEMFLPRLRTLLCPSSTTLSDSLGFPAASFPAVCTGLAAAARINGLAAHCPSATGANKAVPLGEVFLP